MLLVELVESAAIEQHASAVVVALRNPAATSNHDRRPERRPPLHSRRRIPPNPAFPGRGAADRRGRQRLHHPEPHRRGAAPRRSAQEIDAFLAEATSGDYDHLLQTNHGWVDWDQPPPDRQRLRGPASPLGQLSAPQESASQRAGPPETSPSAPSGYMQHFRFPLRAAPWSIRRHFVPGPAAEHSTWHVHLRVTTTAALARSVFAEVVPPTIAGSASVGAQGRGEWRKELTNEAYPHPAAEGPAAAALA